MRWAGMATVVDGDCAVGVGSGNRLRASPDDQHQATPSIIAHPGPLSLLVPQPPPDHPRRCIYT